MMVNLFKTISIFFLLSNVYGTDLLVSTYLNDIHQPKKTMSNFYNSFIKNSLKSSEEEKTLADLNDNALSYVCKYLSLDDLINLRNVNKRFHEKIYLNTKVLNLIRTIILDDDYPKNTNALIEKNSITLLEKKLLKGLLLDVSDSQESIADKLKLSHKLVGGYLDHNADEPLLINLFRTKNIPASIRERSLSILKKTNHPMVLNHIFQGIVHEPEMVYFLISCFFQNTTLSICLFRQCTFEDQKFILDRLMQTLTTEKNDKVTSRQVLQILWYLDSKKSLTYSLTLLNSPESAHIIKEVIYELSFQLSSFQKKTIKIGTCGATLDTLTDLPYFPEDLSKIIG